MTPPPDVGPKGHGEGSRLIRAVWFRMPVITIGCVVIIQLSRFETKTDRGIEASWAVDLV